MGQTGYLTLFTENEPVDPLDKLRALLEHICAASIYMVWRTLGVDNEWELFQQAVHEGGIADDPPAEGMSGPHTIDSVVDAYVSGRSLRIGLGRNAISQRMHDAVREGLPEAIRGEFIPSGLYLCIGGHDIFESSEHDDGYYFGRAFISIKFGGHSSPNDWQETRRRILELPEVNAIKAEFEQIVGPLEAVVMWFV